MSEVAQGGEIPQLTGDGGALAAGAGEVIVAAALAIGRNNIVRALAAIARAHLLHIAHRIPLRPTHLPLPPKLTRVRTARIVRRIAHRALRELARLAVAARRVDAAPRVAVLAVLDDAVPAHLERDRSLDLGQTL